MMGCYCHNPIRKYSFLIDEEGNIYKCPFGILRYAHIKDYVNGGFAQKFKEFNKRFYNIPIPSCSACFRTMRFEKDTCVSCD